MKDPTRNVVALGNITGAVDIDLTQGDVFTATLTGNVTFAIRNPLARETFLLDLTQDGTGNRTTAYNGAGGATLVNPAGATLDDFPSRAAAARSACLYRCGATTFYRVAVSGTPAA